MKLHSGFGHQPTVNPFRFLNIYDEDKWAWFWFRLEQQV